VQPIVDKVTLDRLKDRDLQVSFLCPYCKSTRISLDSSRSADSWNGVDCPKCGAHLLLDSVSVVVIKEAAVTPRG
jgi:predicted RNA-binding Zn-ribbon protein involved in translation (DUF1610 family)